MSRPNLKRLVLSGQKIGADNYNERNIGHEQNLRGGNAGAIINGKAIGKCPRLSMLRVHGVQDPKDMSTLLMFDGGHGSEDYIMRNISAAWEREGGVAFPEGQIRVEWGLPSGRKITGSPDGLLGHVDNGQVIIDEGIEAKCVSSIYTLRDVAIKRIPKNDHVIQTAGYSMALEVPFSIVYTSRVNYHTLPGIRKDAEVAGPRECYDMQGDFLFRLRPSLDIYQTHWDSEDKLHYRHQDEPSWTPTHLTKASIVEYYAHVDQCLTDKEIPMPVSDNHVAGHKENYKACKYCFFQDICKNTPEDYDDFVDQCSELTNQ